MKNVYRHKESGPKVIDLIAQAESTAALQCKSRPGASELLALPVVHKCKFPLCLLLDTHCFLEAISHVYFWIHFRKLKAV